MISAAVIGLGRIGSGYDHGRRASAPARSHLGAILDAGAFGRVVGVDPDSAARAAVGACWGDSVVVAPTLPEGGEGFDVVALCTPSDRRLDLVAQCLDRGARVLVVEKPLSLDVDEARRIVQMAGDAGAELRVNFHRRFDPGIRAARAALGSVPPRLVVMRYGKGLYNYAGHHVDLLLDWFGPIAAVEAIGDDSGDADPVLSFRCRMAAGFDAVVLGLGGLDYDQFEIDVFLADRRLEMRAGGVEKLLYRPVADRFYAGYHHLGEPEAIAPTAPVAGLVDLYQAIAAHLEGGDQLPGCTGLEALAGLEVLAAARSSAAAGGAPIVLGGAA